MFNDTHKNVIKELLDKGLNFHHQLQLEEARCIYFDILKIDPQNFDALQFLGAIGIQTDNPAEALQWLDKAVAINSQDAGVHANRGAALAALHQHQAAIDSYDRALLLDNYSGTWNNRAASCKALERYEETIQSLNQVIAMEPQYADAYTNRGIAWYQLKQYKKAIENYDSAIAINATNPVVYYNKGVCLNEIKKYHAAIDNYDQAIAIKPNYVDAYSNRGIVFHILKKYEKAIGDYNSAIAITPDKADFYFNRAVSFCDLRKYQLSIDDYKKAIALRLDYRDAYYNLGLVLGELQQYQEAIDCNDKALALKSDYPFLYGIRFYSKSYLCDWNHWDTEFNDIIQRIEANEESTPGFQFFSWSDSLDLHYRVSQRWVTSKSVDFPQLAPIPQHPIQKRKKIRIGYFSTDFRVHAVGQIIAELFEQHDRSRFELIAFDFGPQTNDALRQRIQKAFDQFIDIRDKSDLEAAQLARDMQIDIAVDLNGFTGDCRTGIFACRAAPIQMAYIGYPGTMGADFIDYILADKTLIPKSFQKFYSEKVVYMPHSYQVNDRRREVSDKKSSRADFGLPESGFVFCCFNNNNKITPPTFDSWMRILHQVPHSVLWLFADNATAENNLRKEAHQRGIESHRLIFASRIPLSEHLARHRVADLGLDTFPYTGHATTSNALWVGLPVVTRMGESFASRVAGSLLHAMGLPELITTTAKACEALAIDLALNPHKLKAIRNKLEENRLTTPLFNPELFTRHLENAYEQMVQRYDQRLPPATIFAQAVLPSDTTKPLEKTSLWGKISGFFTARPNK